MYSYGTHCVIICTLEEYSLNINHCSKCMHLHKFISFLHLKPLLDKILLIFPPPSLNCVRKLSSRYLRVRGMLPLKAWLSICFNFIMNAAKIYYKDKNSRAIFKFTSKIWRDLHKFRLPSRLFDKKNSFVLQGYPKVGYYKVLKFSPSPCVENRDEVRKC